MLKMHMKKLALLLLLVSTSIFAQTSVKIIKFEAVCGTLEQVIAVLKKFEELPMLQMTMNRATGGDKEKNVENATIMFVNSKTQSFTIVEQVSDSVLCVIGSGTNTMPFGADK
jgi:hypothetical protein